MLHGSAFVRMYGAEQVLTCSASYAQSKANSQNIKMVDLKEYEYLIIITFRQSVTENHITFAHYNICDIESSRRYEVNRATHQLHFKILVVYERAVIIYIDPHTDN
jgi:hypothetical protein